MLDFGIPAQALLRQVPNSFAECLHSDRSQTLDPERARAQLKQYAHLLKRLGIAVSWVASDESCPDACFIEDTAVILTADRAVLTHPGAPSRRAEVPPVAAGLIQMGLEMFQVPTDARLDGGDVLRIDSVLLVGLSSRSNLAGAEALGRAATPLGLRVQTEPVRDGLHLKSAISLLAPDRAVIYAGTPIPAGFNHLHWIEVEEPAGANVLALGQQILISTAAPETHKRLSRERDLVLWPLDVSEFHKADGALTCLSLRRPLPQFWCC